MIRYCFGTILPHVCYMLYNTWRIFVNSGDTMSPAIPCGQEI